MARATRWNGGRTAVILRRWNHHNKSTGAIVKDLAQQDFRLEEDGRPQKIRYFSRESELPLVLGLLVDTSQSMRPMFKPVRVASNRFFEQVLREDRDEAAIVHFDVATGVLQDFTSSREKLACTRATADSSAQVRRHGLVRRDP